MIDGGEAIRKLALNVVRYTGLAPLARPIIGGIGAIMMLHRVTAKPERPNGVNRHLNIAPDFLDAVITDMKAYGYTFVTLDEAIDRTARGGRDGLFATITADDAYRDNLVEALPVLARHNAPITVYVAPALIDGTAFLWWDVIDDLFEKNSEVKLRIASGEVVLDSSTPPKKVAAHAWLHDHLTTAVSETGQYEIVAAVAAAHGIDPADPSRKTLMNWDEIRAMADHPLVTIGAHTINHYNLKRLDESAARHEIVEAGALIQKQTGVAPTHMAYPYGYASAVGSREVTLAREAGYRSAVTTRHGVLRAEHAHHPHALPRISVNGRYQRLAHIRTMLSGVTTPLANSGKMLVTV